MNEQMMDPTEGSKTYKVFLAYPAADVAGFRNDLKIMLENAGFTVLPAGDPPKDDRGFAKAVEEALAEADCSIHALGAEYGKTFLNDRKTSQAKLQFDLAEKAARAASKSFLRLVWNCPVNSPFVEAEQQEFVNFIQNHTFSGLYYTSVVNPAQLVEDFKNLLAKPENVFNVPKVFDICVVANEQDSKPAQALVDALKDKYNVKSLMIRPSSDDAKFQAVWAIPRSKLAVVYFKEATDWAAAFIKEIWKRAGGVSSGTPYLLLGEDEPRRNRFVKFRGPQIVPSVVPAQDVGKAVEEAFRTVEKSGRLDDEIYCPYTGIRPFNENESIFFKGREKHIDRIVEMLQARKFVMVTGSSGDGKSSLIFAGVIPSMKSGFLKATYSRWAVASFRPEREPLRNLTLALSNELRLRDPDVVESALGYGFSALVDLYKKSPIYVDVSSPEWTKATPAERVEMRKQGANLLILVDQFEEFFTNTENYRDNVASPSAQITVNVLLETIRIAQREDLPIYVVFTMRSDYIGQCVAFRGFAEMIGFSTFFVPRLQRDEVQEVIEAPAMLNGNKVAPRLAQRLLNDLGDGIDQLPVLQHALLQMWTGADRGAEPVDLRHYAEVGGLPANRLPAEDRADFDRWFERLPDEKRELYEKPRLRNVLNRHANELYETAHVYVKKTYGVDVPKEEAQRIVRSTFTALTKIDRQRAVRNRSTLLEITRLMGYSDDRCVEVARVVNYFREPGNNFIQPFITDAPESREIGPFTVLDITHESLIRNWERLVEWAEAENKDAEMFAGFKTEIRRWIDNDYHPRFLLSTGMYAFYYEWYKQKQPNPAWVLRYLSQEELNPDTEPLEQAAVFLEDMEEFFRRTRARIERNKRLVYLALGFISLLLVIASFLGWRAFQEAGESKKQTQLALKQKVEADKQKIKADLSSLDAQEQKTLGERKQIEAEYERMQAEKFRKMAEGKAQTAEEAEKMALQEKRIAEINARLAQIQEEQAEKSRFIAEEEKERARISETKANQDRDVAKKQTRESLRNQSLYLAEKAIQETDMGNADVGVLLALEGLPESPDPDDRPYTEQAEAALYYAANAKVNGRPFRIFPGAKNRISLARFSQDGRFLVVASWDKSVVVYDVLTGKASYNALGHDNIIDEAVFTPDGSGLATICRDLYARHFNLVTGKETVYKGHRDNLTAVAPVGKNIATASLDATVQIWNRETGETVHTLRGHKGAVNCMAASGSLLATGGADFSVRLWNSATGDAAGVFSGHAGKINAVKFSGNGAYLASAAGDNTAKVWDVRGGRLVFTLAGHTRAVNAVAFSPDGARLATASSDGSVRVWDPFTGKQLVRIGVGAPAKYVEYSPDGRRLLITVADGNCYLHDGVSFLRLAKFSGHPGDWFKAPFSPGGEYVAVAQAVGNTVSLFRTLPAGFDLINYANRELKTRDLSPEERKRYYVDDPGSIEKK